LIVLDYHSSCVSLNEFVAALAAETFTNPVLTTAKDEAVSAVGAEGDRALIGAFVYHLITHAASDGSELDLLERAAALWTRGSALCGELGTIRADLESALEKPRTPGAADRFNAAAVSAQNLAQKANELRVEVNALRLDVLKFPHLPPHPRQEDRKTAEWDWGNLSLARRTDAFVRTLFRLVSDQGTLAFAVGVAAAYGANVTGSAYIGHAVGGPRRMHRHRDRIARNAFGSWLATRHPAAESPSKMAGRIAFGAAGAPILPTDLDSLVREALGRTFDTARTVPIPDLQLGYGRLVQHLKLLDAFSMPDLPSTLLRSSSPPCYRTRRTRPRLSARKTSMSMERTGVALRSPTVARPRVARARRVHLMRRSRVGAGSPSLSSSF